MENKNCLRCGSPVYGRPDKKFCSDECKNSYHYKKTGRIRRYRDRVIAELDRNYSILNSLLSLGITHVPVAELERAGFNFGYSTGCRKNSKGHDEFSCFDIRYCRTATKVFGIEQSKDLNASML